jgi:thioredoxin-related protein
MKKFFFLWLFLLSAGGFAQTAAVKLYNPGANAEKDITEALKKARLENKHVFIQAGGNWCYWCLEFNRFTKAEKQVDSLLHSDYVVYHLNYSPENKNVALFTKYGFPQRFGFPVFIILDVNGNRIHTQNSGYLEQGKSYNKRKVIEFLGHWNRRSINPQMYKN